ncbi:hypothetical protein EDC04DRAFT_2602373 [Pisolithus marmoratus]|nr:hypothetical protein EDC04DRAFT_2602373 [Pisolithus marmoratus]
MNMKELLFSLSNLNYIEFFQAILHKHGLEDYMVTERKHFPLNYIPLEGLRVKKLPQTSKSKGSGSSEDDELEPASDSAKEDGQAIIANPLNIKSFNLANKVPFLHPVCKAAAQPVTPTTMDLNSLTSAILLQTLTQLDTGLHQSLAPPASTLPTFASPTPDSHSVSSTQYIIPPLQVK